MKKPAICVISLLAAANAASATYQDDIGHTALQDELGALTPTGAGVRVSQVESAVGATSSGGPIFAPDPSGSVFLGKNFSYPTATPAPTEFSGHATGVGGTFYGNAGSIAPGIADIYGYEVNPWINSLYNPSGAASTTNRRIANHGWAGNGSTPSETSTILRLVDRQVERNEYIQVAATGTALIGNAYNVIAVGRTAGGDGGSAAVDGAYIGGRARPDLVAPQPSLSHATPVVAAAAALLVQTGHQAGAALSHGSRSVPGAGTVYNAERSETVKAALMAGADRRTDNGGTLDEISDYRGLGHQTSNGLDDRYGAGQVNIYNSYHIIAAGEQDSLEDGGGTIGLHGFDYDPSFGGVGDSNGTATYTFVAGANEVLATSLAWNQEVTNNVGMSMTLRRLSLALVDVTNGNTVLSTSASLADNTQNIHWRGLIGGNTYQIKVNTLGNSALDWDYALAWRRTAAIDPVPIPGAFWLFGAALAGTWRLCRGLKPRA